MSGQRHNSAAYSYDGGNRLTSQTNTLGSGAAQTQHSYGCWGTNCYDASSDRTSVANDGVATTYTC
ncbi:MAG TPA: hypothetical protein VE338_07270 [Ktedonobacterales bacterium]|nr:hypothetical protein [Ktedonobacterales bacterium]